MFARIKNLYHALEAAVFTVYYGFPAYRIKVIGVTGTDGKTTTTHLISHILRHAGKRASMLSSIYAYIGGKEYDTGFHVTTPRPRDVQRFLSLAVKHKDEYFILETTSHAIDQQRIFAIPFAASLVTNITPEHLYHHKTFQHYLEIKTRLLIWSSIRIVNKDMDAFAIVKAILDAFKKPFVTYSLKKDADYVWSDDIKTSLFGDYNKENIMAAYALLSECGIGKDLILSGIQSFQLPKGRGEIAYKGDYQVFIDFAHTSNAILQLLKSLRGRFPKRRIIHVFGSASQRDDQKRPIMGENSARYSDVIILTEEDFRNESVETICNEIGRGVEKHQFSYVSPEDVGKRPKTYTIIPDRQQAIDAALRLAKKGDIIVLTGKGHEKSLNRFGMEVAWDEFEAVKEAMKKKQGPREK